MSYKKLELEGLKEFIPEGCFEAVIHYIKLYNIWLKITVERRTVHGTYRNATASTPHIITVNRNLNKFAFLITFLHELAHLTTFEKYKHSVLPHGREWKNEFSRILVEFLNHKVFPADIEQALIRGLHNPAASSCSDAHLNRTLKKYDKTLPGVTLIETLLKGDQFLIKGGRRFVMEEKIRTRYKCRELSTGKRYLFQGLYEVKKIEATG